jgi:hypothetical protein
MLRALPLIVFLVVIILAIGVTLWLMLGPTPSGISRSRKRTMDKAARLRRPGGPATFDFRDPTTGSMIDSMVGEGNIAHGHLWTPHYPAAGDTVIWTDLGQERRFRLTWVQSDPSDDHKYLFEAVSG